MKKITILLLHMQHGGIEKQTIALANALSKRYKVKIISTYSMLKAPAYSVNNGIEIKYLMDDKPNKEEIKNAIKQKKILSLIRQGIKAIKILYLKKNLMIREIKSLDCDYVLSTRIEFAEMLSKYAPERTVTMTQEHLHDDSKKYVDRAKKAFKNLDYLLVLCDGSRENFSKWLSDNKRIKIVQIPNILDKIPDDSAKLSGNRLVSVGRLHPVKNFETLISVFEIVKREIPDARLTIVGGGEEFEKLSLQIKQLNLESDIKITGMVNSDTVMENMLSSDLYVMTSHTECFPMVLLEASSVGLPLISFDVPVGPKAIINHNENGYLIEYGNKEEMAQKIIDTFKNRDLLKKLGEKSKEISYKYTEEKIMPMWHELFS